MLPLGTRDAMLRPPEPEAWLAHSKNLLLPIPTVSPRRIPLVYSHIKSLQRASSVEKPLPGGEKRRDGRAAHPVAWWGFVRDTCLCRARDIISYLAPLVMSSKVGERMSGREFMPLSST